MVRSWSCNCQRIRRFGKFVTSRPLNEVSLEVGWRNVTEPRQVMFQPLTSRWLTPRALCYLVATHVVDVQLLYPVMHLLQLWDHVIDERVRRLDARVDRVVCEPLNWPTFIYIFGWIKLIITKCTVAQEMGHGSVCVDLWPTAGNMSLKITHKPKDTLNTWPMGQVFSGLQGSWVTASDLFPAQ